MGRITGGPRSLDYGSFWRVSNLRGGHNHFGSIHQVLRLISLRVLVARTLIVPFKYGVYKFPKVRGTFLAGSR